MTCEYRVVVLGATGAVGTEMVQLLKSRDFPLASLKLLASERSAGKWIAFGEESLPVEVLSRQALQSADLVLGAVDSDTARAWAPVVVEAGAVFIDNSSAFRQDQTVPLVVPEVNAADLASHTGIVANPNCSTILMVLAVWPLHQRRPVKRLLVATYQAASGAGAAGMAELETQTRQVLSGEPVKPEVFPHPIAFNLFPHDSTMGPDFYCEEELKMIRETRRIFHQPDLAIGVTCVRVPVLRAHSEALNIEFHEAFPVEEAVELLKSAPGVCFAEDWVQNRFAMPITASGKDEVFVGRVRTDLSCANALDLWLSGDQIRKGAALNAVQIAEHLCGRNL